MIVDILGAIMEVVLLPLASTIHEVSASLEDKDKSIGWKTITKASVGLCALCS